MERPRIVNNPPNDAAESPNTWVEQYGDLLFRTAVSRVADRAVAEDLVQEAFLAAWRGRDKFDGRSERGTWLIAILKRKIVDHYRATGRSREVPAGDDSHDTDLFDSRGLWRSSVGKLSLEIDDPVDREEFWRVLSGCVRELPSTLAQAFAVRELECRPATEAAAELAISRENLAVRLHRARLLLRGCLEHRWLGEREAKS
ncbi:sigma-70 family RNA polymerase sigma factor [Aeoliella mucimassa]|uniref:RNA polymerase sigma factor n=1 Tax=Aeoliella mucimassa TaxID=2527972 RepID=A0A518AWF0_9BACT|nr:sigma-70 family RNA polymerase sigma factor [Aeoliella mucimassa]QDU59052.1 RNA polymerase sigma factor SigM [Aeoliella mucimassa]